MSIFPLGVLDISILSLDVLLNSKIYLNLLSKFYKD